MTVVLAALSANGVVRPHVLGDRQTYIEGLTFSGTYKTGGDATLGESLKSLLSQIGLGSIHFVHVTGVPGYLFVYNYETDKLQVFEGGGSGAVFKELAEAEYPALIRTGSKPRLFALGV